MQVHEHPAIDQQGRAGLAQTAQGDAAFHVFPRLRIGEIVLVEAGMPIGAQLGETIWLQASADDTSILRESSRAGAGSALAPAARALAYEVAARARTDLPKPDAVRFETELGEIGVTLSQRAAGVA